MTQGAPSVIGHGGFLDGGYQRAEPKKRTGRRRFSSEGSSLLQVTSIVSDPGIALAVALATNHKKGLLQLALADKGS